MPFTVTVALNPAPSGEGDVGDAIGYALGVAEHVGIERRRKDPMHGEVGEFVRRNFIRAHVRLHRDRVSPSKSTVTAPIGVPAFATGEVSSLAADRYIDVEQGSTPHVGFLPLAVFQAPMVVWQWLRFVLPPLLRFPLDSRSNRCNWLWPIARRRFGAISPSALPGRVNRPRLLTITLSHSVCRCSSAKCDTGGEGYSALGFSVLPVRLIELEVNLHARLSAEGVDSEVLSAEKLPV